MTGATSEPAADWAQFFHLNQPHHPFNATSIPADSTVVTTSPAATVDCGGGGVSRSVGKAPPRKRSRASRRAPTTLLNTDTANFRAMVQQFTGVPTGPYNSDVFGFGFGSENSAMPQPQRQYYEYRPPQQQQQQPQQQDVMHMGYGMAGNAMDDGPVIPGFFFDGLGRGYTFNG